MKHGMKLQEHGMELRGTRNGTGWNVIWNRMKRDMELDGTWNRTDRMWNQAWGQLQFSITITITLLRKNQLQLQLQLHASEKSQLQIQLQLLC